MELSAAAPDAEADVSSSSALAGCAPSLADCRVALPECACTATVADRATMAASSTRSRRRGLIIARSERSGVVSSLC